MGYYDTDTTAITLYRREDGEPSHYIIETYQKGEKTREIKVKVSGMKEEDAEPLLKRRMRECFLFRTRDTAYYINDENGDVDHIMEFK